MNIVCWFNSNNIEHLKAYKHLQDTGCWPEDFLPEGIWFNPAWTIGLVAKIAKELIEERISRPTTYYEDYSYYVGGEIMAGRIPLKYSPWVDAGRPA